MRPRADLRVVLASLLLLLLMPASAKADSVYSNFSPGYTDSGNAVSVAGSNFGGEYYAVSFTPTNTITFTDALADLLWFTGEPTVDAYLMSDNGGLPGLAFATLIQSGSIGNGTVAFTCAANCPVLTAGTQYWLELQETDPNTSIGWYLSSTDFSNGTDETVRYTYYGPDSPFYWPVDYRNAFEIDGTSVANLSNALDDDPLGDPNSVPEPGTLDLLLGGLAALGCAARFKLLSRPGK